MSTLNRKVFPDNYNITGKDTIPAAITLTGTYSTNNADANAGKLVTGAGTLFQTEILDTRVKHPKLKYKWLFDPATVTVREIAYVLSNTSLMLKVAFPSNVAALTAVKCPDSTIEYLEVSVIASAAGQKVNGSSVLLGSVVNFTKNDNGLTPIAVDGNGSILQIETEK